MSGFLAFTLAVLAHPIHPAAATDSTAPAQLAASGLLLDLARAGDRIVAVGDHGLIVLSKDDGKSWTQITAVPVQSMLTCVAFSDADHGWAGGHGGVLLRTNDGGASWNRIDVPTNEHDSFLDILALDENRIMAAGAYGLFCLSDDGGDTWEIRPILEEDMHINRLSPTPDGEILLAGESGTLAVSTDRGETWQQLSAPYDGSFYGLHALSTGRWLAHGLRGHVFVSDDRGANWRQVPLEHEVLLMTAIESTPGEVALSGLGGFLFLSTDGAETFVTTRPDSITAVSEILAVPGGDLVVAGDNGVRRLAVP